MKLTLDPLDLKSEFQEHNEVGEPIDQACNTSQVDFDKLRRDVQEAVRAVGRATFYAWDNQTYNAIYPPKARTAEPRQAEITKQKIQKLAEEITEFMLEGGHWRHLIPALGLEQFGENGYLIGAQKLKERARKLARDAVKLHIVNGVQLTPELVREKIELLSKDLPQE